MNEIIFRGRIKKRKWVKGYLSDKSTINDGSKIFEVDEDTIGLCTGLQDMNGQKIFEGDILEDTETTIRYLVKWFDEYAGFYIANEEGRIEDGLNTDSLLPYLKVIGNIYDEPDELSTKWL